MPEGQTKGRALRWAPKKQGDRKFSPTRGVALPSLGVVTNAPRFQPNQEGPTLIVAQRRQVERISIPTKGKGASLACEPNQRQEGKIDRRRSRAPSQPVAPQRRKESRRRRRERELARPRRTKQRRRSCAHDERGSRLRPTRRKEYTDAKRTDSCGDLHTREDTPGTEAGRSASGSQEKSVTQEREAAPRQKKKVRSTRREGLRSHAGKTETTYEETSCARPTRADRGESKVPPSKRTT